MKFKKIPESISSNEWEKQGIGAVVMDMQPNLMDTIHAVNQLTETIILQMKVFNLLQIPICLTEQVPEKLGSTHPDIVHQNTQGICFWKKTFSAFGSDAFSAWIESNKISHLLIAGIETPICIYQTSIDALRMKLQVTILSDCIGARREADGRDARKQLSAFGCTIIPLETVIYSYLRDPSHLHFRDISRLIRERTET